MNDESRIDSITFDAKQSLEDLSNEIKKIILKVNQLNERISNIEESYK